MADQQHLDLLRQGVLVWNDWREERKEEEWENSFERRDQVVIKKRYPRLVDLSDADLEEWDLRGVNLSGANLKGTRFIRANLREANLSQADLYGALFNQANLENADLKRAYLGHVSVADASLWKADLREADLSWTSFFHAFLVEADLRQAVLTQTNFTWAMLHGMNVEEAVLNHTIFGDVDLSEVKGLERTHYRRPSIIDICTLARSSGRIPEAFLQQVGIESTLIPSLLGLFHPYHGAEAWWWSEEEPREPWRTDKRPEGVPRIWPGSESWVHADIPSDGTT